MEISKSCFCWTFAFATFDIRHSRSQMVSLSLNFEHFWNPQIRCILCSSRYFFDCSCSFLDSPPPPPQAVVFSYKQSGSIQFDNDHDIQLSFFKSTWIDFFPQMLFLFSFLYIFRTCLPMKFPHFVRISALLPCPLWGGCEPFWSDVWGESRRFFFCVLETYLLLFCILYKYVPAIPQNDLFNFAFLNRRMTKSLCCAKIKTVERSMYIYLYTFC